jgi:hypothetical protein
MATNRLEAILAEARNLSPDELSQLIKYAADMLAQSRKQPTTTAPPYRSLFGAGKGSFATPVEADRFVREERDAWDE